jgi:hypothetical protein
MHEGKGQSRSSEQKLEALLEYERLREEELRQFLRGKGLHEALYIFLAQQSHEFVIDSGPPDAALAGHKKRLLYYPANLGSYFLCFTDAEIMPGRYTSIAPRSCRAIWKV